MIDLVKIEKKIHAYIDSEDLENPDLFIQIKNLSAIWLYRHRKCNSYADAEEVGSILAEFLYLRLLNPNTKPIGRWIKYIAKVYPIALKEWLRISTTQIVDAKNNENLEKAILQMSAGSTIDNENIAKMYDWNYLNNLPSLVDSVMLGSRFALDTVPYLNAKITLLISIYHNRYICFGLSNEDSMYARMLYRVLCDRMMIELKPDISDNSLTLLKDFYLEEYIDELE